jgi:hypothetical protein
VATATTNATYDAARALAAAGLSVIPVALDGTKAPAWAVLPRVPDPDRPDRMKPTWKPFQERIADRDELQRWFARSPLGVAVVGGAVSGGAECLDLDNREVAAAFLGELRAEDPDLFAKLHREETPNGLHLWYRCGEVAGNTKLAEKPDGHDDRGRPKTKTLIETRGEGGYAVVAGSPDAVHSSGVPYRHVGGPPLTDLAELTVAERNLLLRLAMSFDRTDERHKAGPADPRDDAGELSPADDYDTRGPSFDTLLPDATFQNPGRDKGNVRRPDKERGYSGTVGHCRGRRGEPLLKVFSTNWHPFEAGRCYGRFHVLRLTRFDKDGAECMRWLRSQGFGSPRAKTVGTNGFSRNGPPNGTTHKGNPTAGVKAEAPPAEPDLEIATAAWPGRLEPAALHGVAGEVVAAIDPHTEADPAAILSQFLVGFGSMAGRKAFYRVESTRHYPNLFAVLVGQSSRARKGTSWQRALRVLERGGDQGWAKARIVSGLSSGEGLIWEVRDPIVRKPRRAGEDEEEADPGIEDKRLLVIEEEFATVLQVGKREGNILGGVLRSAWDTGKLRSLTKNSPARATGAHVSIISHITRTELLETIHSTQAHNGFLNRFLWFAVRRSKLLPFGGLETDIAPIAAAVEGAWKFAHDRDREIELTRGAREMWALEYPRLTADRPGLFGAVTSRAEAQVIRLALVYALLDRSESIEVEHLEAALAVERYVEQSARYVFGDATGDPLADEIRSVLRANPDGVGQLDLIHRFDRHKSKAELEKALALLVQMGAARRERTPTGGRPKVTWHSCEQSEQSEQTT